MSPEHKRKREKDKELEAQGLSESRELNLFESEQRPEIVVMRQEPEKIEQIKQFLYSKIKEELLEEMKKNKEQKEVELNEMIEDEKRRKLNEIIEQRRLEEQRKKEEEEEQRIAQLEKERKKIDVDIRVAPIQYA